MTRPRTSVYIATSLDGFIAGPEGQIGWLEEGAGEDEGDHGFASYMAGIDAVVMGRNTFEILRGFEEWPYGKPVYVLSSSLAELPDRRAAGLLSGTPVEVLDELAAMGHGSLYIDGGITIQQFLDRDLIDEMTITRLPIVLGRGIPLFAEMDRRLRFRHLGTEVLAGRMVMSRYERDRGA